MRLYRAGSPSLDMRTITKHANHHQASRKPLRPAPSSPSNTHLDVHNYDTWLGGQKIPTTMTLFSNYSHRCFRDAFYPAGGSMVESKPPCHPSPVTIEMPMELTSRSSFCFQPPTQTPSSAVHDVPPGPSTGTAFVSQKGCSYRTKCL